MKKIIYMLLFLSTAYAVDTTMVCNEYVVFVSSLPKFTFKEKDITFGRTSIDQTGGYPDLLSRVIFMPNKNYWIVRVSTMTNTQNTFLNNANVKKCIYKTRSWSIDKNETLQVISLRDYPTDIYTVDTSTP